LRYPPDPPTVEEIVAVMRQAGDSAHGARLRALIVLLWRAGLRINEALTLTEHDLEAGRVGTRPSRQGRPPPRGRHGPVGLGPPPALAGAPHGDAGWTAFVRDRGCDPRAALGERRRARAVAARRLNGRVRRRFAPHQLRHAHAVELAHEGVPLNVIQRQLGHTNLGVTSIYLQGIDNAEIIATVHARKSPMIPASTGLRL
jgi:site-specific recombinase XerD